MKYSLAETTIVMIITLSTCFSIFFFIRTFRFVLIGGNLTAQTMELEEKLKFQRCNGKLSLTSFSSLLPEHPQGELAYNGYN